MANTLSKKDILRTFNNSDIGKVFWRVEYRGHMTKCAVSDVNEKGEAVIELYMLTDLKNLEYKLKDKVECCGRSTCSSDILRNNKDFYFSFNQAKKASLSRYNVDVNPNGTYKVARYFDDIFVCYVTNELPRKSAQKACNELNQKADFLVSYSLKLIK